MIRLRFKTPAQVQDAKQASARRHERVHDAGLDAAVDVGKPRIELAVRATARARDPCDSPGDAITEADAKTRVGRQAMAARNIELLLADGKHQRDIVDSHHVQGDSYVVPLGWQILDEKRRSDAGTS